MIGFSTTSFIYSAGTFLYFFWGQAILFGLFCILTVILLTREERRLKKAQFWLQKYLFITGPVELIKIGQYGFLLGAMINVTAPDFSTTSADSFSYFLSVVLIVIYIGFPLAIFAIFIYFGLNIPYIRQSLGLRDDERYQQHLKVLSAGLREDNFLSLTYPFVFLARRYFFILLFLGNKTENQFVWFCVI